MKSFSELVTNPQNPLAPETLFQASLNHHSGHEVMIPSVSQCVAWSGKFDSIPLFNKNSVNYMKPFQT